MKETGGLEAVWAAGGVAELPPFSQGVFSQGVFSKGPSAQDGLSQEGVSQEGLSHCGLGHPTLLHYDAVRALLVQSGLPPEPEIYELFWLHVTGADVALSRALAERLAAGELDADAVKELRRRYLGDIAAAEVLALLETTQACAAGLADQLARGHADLKGFDAAIAAEDETLAVARGADELTQLVQRLRRANAVMMAANRRMGADIQKARLETGRLLERLGIAERAARTDPLTGLLNRRGILDALRAAIQGARGEGQPLTVGLADIDNFKRMNDQWGHSIGDEVLRCVATHLQAQARRIAGEGATAGRYGGEEFVVILPGLGLAEASAGLDSARAGMARQVLRRADDGQVLGRVSFSAGIALLRADDSVESLVDRADSALFGAKRAGRDRVQPERPGRPGARMAMPASGAG